MVLEKNKQTPIQEVISHFFKSKGVESQELKESAKAKKIIYSRFTRPAKQLIELAGSVEKAKSVIDIVATWAKSRNLDYTIETVFKKWFELDNLKPKEIVKKPYYKGDPMVEKNGKRYVIVKSGEWLEYVGKKADEKDITWQ